MVAANVVKEAQEYLAAGVPVGAHLADQLLLPLACAGEGSFITQPLSRHAETNIAIIRKFFYMALNVENLAKKQRLVGIGRIS